MACALLLHATPVAAQQRAWTGVAAGSDDELYLRSLQLMGALPATSWTSRPLANSVLDSAALIVNPSHPWSRRLPQLEARSAVRFNWRGASIEGGWNSAFTWGGNDGARWQGRGVNAVLTTGVLFRWKPLTIRLEPQLVYAANTAFPVLPTEAGVGSDYVDRMRPLAIDLPDRFGNSPFQRLDVGESEIRVEGHGFAAALSNRTLFLGPAFRNSLMLGNNAPGFAHLSLGTTNGIHTPIGKFATTFVYARLAQSSFAPDKREGARLATATLVSWRPPSGKGIEVGAIRFYHRDWPTDGLHLSDLKLPFGSLFGDREVQGVAPPDNQLISLFARAVSTRVGLEVFGEFARNDRSSSLRDLFVEPEHNSAWSAGFLKVIGERSASHIWTARAEYLNGRITSLERFRAQSTLYEHATITQGHTNAGQLLGSPLLERTGGFEVAADRWGQNGRLGVMIQQRAMPLTRNEGVPAGGARAQWALEFNGTRQGIDRAYSWRAGTTRDFNRTPGHDAANYFLGVGLSIGHR